MTIFRDRNRFIEIVLRFALEHDVAPIKAFATALTDAVDTFYVEPRRALDEPKTENVSKAFGYRRWTEIGFAAFFALAVYGVPG